MYIIFRLIYFTLWETYNDKTLMFSVYIIIEHKNVNIEHKNYIIYVIYVMCTQSLKREDTTSFSHLIV